MPLLSKTARPQDVGLSPIQADASNQAKATALRWAVNSGLATGGTFLGLGLLRGLGKLTSSAMPPADKMELTTGDVTIRPPEDDEEERKPSRRPVRKAAGDGDYADQAVAAAIPTPVGKPAPTAFLSPGWWRGDGQTDPLSVPWAMPAIATSITLAGLGGNALAKWLTAKRLKADHDSEVDEATQDYEKALDGLRKGASLDDCWQKVAGLTKTGGVLGTATGVYGTAAALMALLAGYAVYKHQRKDDPAKGMAEALDERTRLRALSSPPPIRLSTEKDTEDQA